VGEHEWDPCVARGAQPGVQRDRPQQGWKVLRADTANYSHNVIAGCQRGGARFSITARHNRHLDAAISRIEQDSWTPSRYPNAIWDKAEQRLISDAEVAEITYTAFTSRRKDEHVTARLIVRRVRRLNLAQRELIPGWRYHAVFTNSPLEAHTPDQAQQAPSRHASSRDGGSRVSEGPGSNGHSG
jgi:hypothetical protein